MREAAGVLLIVISIVNFAGAVVYGFVGGVTQVVGSVAEQAADSPELRQSARNNEEVKASAGLVKVLGGAVRIFAFGLLVLAVCEIVAAVFLFQATKAVFVLCIAAFEILVDGSLLILLSFNGAIFPLLGILTGVLAILGALEIQSKEREQIY